jgi:hypothetical protein
MATLNWVWNTQRIMLQIPRSMANINAVLHCLLSSPYLSVFFALQASLFSICHIRQTPENKLK